MTLEIDAISQANIVTKQGVKVGLYFDDSMPNLESWIAKAKANCQWAPYKFVSVPMNHAGHHWPGMINLLEWYPYHAGWNPGRMPGGYAGYILQRNYPGYILAQDPNAHIKAPTVLQYRKILIEALLKRPKFIFYY